MAVKLRISQSTPDSFAAHPPRSPCSVLPHLLQEDLLKLASPIEIGLLAALSELSVLATSRLISLLEERV